MERSAIRAALLRISYSAHECVCGVAAMRLYDRAGEPFYMVRDLHPARPTVLTLGLEEAADWIGSRAPLTAEQALELGGGRRRLRVVASHGAAA